MDSGRNIDSPTSSSSSAKSTPPSSPSEARLSPVKPSKSTFASSQSAYSRWRPRYHLQPPSGWLNDPCAPFYNPKTRLYHASFQWNPNGSDWGNISWGSATSLDLVRWYVQIVPSLEPETEYDREGVFTGCLIPSTASLSNTERDEGSILTVAYTSVSELPIHHTLPHVEGSESLSLAQSFDNGKSWHKHASNPIILHEPDGLEVTGFRDPFVAPWRAMSELLSLDSEETLFGVISGGIREVTPTTFLYAINRSDITSWNYVGPLVDVGCNVRLSKWSGDLGKNWEVVNFMTLKDEDRSEVEREFLIMGTEGCLPSVEGPSKSKTLPRPERCQLWMSDSLRKNSTTSPVTMTPNAVGYLDHGCFYAANSFHDPISDKQIVWGWVTEDDLCDELRHAQGWSGLLSLPRELRLQTLKHVVHARTSALQDITSIETDQEQPLRVNGGSQQLWTVRTLATGPPPNVVETLRSAPNARCSTLGESPLGPPRSSTVAGFLGTQIQTSTWELSASIKVSKNCRNVGFALAHSADLSSSTTLVFSPSDETVTIHRPKLPGPGSDEMINSEPERAPHTLFTSLDPETKIETEETLDIRAWRDNSVLEVFVNGRTAISTRIYGAEKTFGLRFFAEDVKEYERSELLCATLWDGVGVQ